jgi:hypothetical protein
MLALLFVAAGCALAEPEPGYAIHVREQTTPERVVRVAVAGDETVTDAVGRLWLPPALLAQMDMWVARPGPAGERRVHRVDWLGIAERGLTRTNYALLPGDRLFLQQRAPD